VALRFDWGPYICGQFTLAEELKSKTELIKWFNSKYLRRLTIKRLEDWDGLAMNLASSCGVERLA
jgi:hypothetical protein